MRVENMFGFAQSLLMCATAGIFLSLVFLTPAGAFVGALNGIVVGIFVSLGALRHQRDEC
jgi:ammonia channel protein AmtB